LRDWCSFESELLTFSDWSGKNGTGEISRCHYSLISNELVNYIPWEA